MQNDPPTSASINRCTRVQGNTIASIKRHAMKMRLSRGVRCRKIRIHGQHFPALAVGENRATPMSEPTGAPRRHAMTRFVSAHRAHWACRVGLSLSGVAQSDAVAAPHYSGTHSLALTLRLDRPLIFFKLQQQRFSPAPRFGDGGGVQRVGILKDQGESLAEVVGLFRCAC